VILVVNELNDSHSKCQIDSRRIADGSAPGNDFASREGMLEKTRAPRSKETVVGAWKSGSEQESVRHPDFIGFP